METKTDAALILKAELMAKEYWYHDPAECPGVDLAHQLASRLKAANEKLAQIETTFDIILELDKKAEEIDRD